MVCGLDCISMIVELQDVVTFPTKKRNVMPLEIMVLTTLYYLDTETNAIIQCRRTGNICHL